MRLKVFRTNVIALVTYYLLLIVYRKFVDGFTPIFSFRKLITAFKKIIKDSYKKFFHLE